MARVPIYYFTNWQKWHLVLAVFVVYWPIRLYIALDQFNLALLLRIWPFWIMEIVVTILFLGLWLAIIDWIQSQIFRLVRNGFVFDVSAQVVTLLIAAGLAIAFNLGFYWLWQTMARTEAVQLIRSSAPRSSHLRHPKKPTNQQQKVDTSLTIMAMLSVFYLSANRRGHRQLEDMNGRTERLKQEVEQAQFVTLQNQVNPQFLFNNLNTLSSLIKVNPKESIQLIDQLSKSYRYVLDQRHAKSVTLQEELDFLQTYLFLLQTRLGDTFKLVTDIVPQEARRYRIVPSTLQVLVENAVRHNQMSAEVPLLVTIELEEDYLVITNLMWPRPQTEPSTGLGLKTISKHYQLLTDQPVLIHNQANVFQVKIPLLS